MSAVRIHDDGDWRHQPMRTVIGGRREGVASYAAMRPEEELGESGVDPKMRWLSLPEARGCRSYIPSLTSTGFEDFSYIAHGDFIHGLIAEAFVNVYADQGRSLPPSFSEATILQPFFAEIGTERIEDCVLGFGAPTRILPAASPFDEALARLRRFESWQEDWDGEGAPAPDRAALRSASTLLSLISTPGLDFAAHLDADGHPTLMPLDRETRGRITIDGPDQISFEFERAGEIFEDYDIHFDGRHVPDALQAALRQI